MDLLNLVKTIKTDLECQYGIPLKINMLNGETSVFFLRVMENDNNNGLGFDIHLKYRKIILKMHSMHRLISKSQAEQCRINLNTNLNIFLAFYKKLLDLNGVIELIINGERKNINESLLIKEWNSIELINKSRFIDVLDFNEYNYENFKDILSAFWGVVLSFSNISNNNTKKQLLFEGKQKYKISKLYERSLINRQACILLKGTNCTVCGMSFEDKYGKIGRNFIEIHHLIPISTYKTQTKINPLTDLIPLCSNCHAIIHKKQPPYSIEELKEKINENK